MLLSDHQRAGFSKRLFAYNLDITVMLLVIWPVSLFIPQNEFFYPLAVALVSLYHALMESSSWQGTLGKRYAQLVVTDEHGAPIGFGQALLRIVAKFLSLAVLFIGFFMIYFRKDRKGLHDMIAKTKVLIRN
ncbi:RDD family protein [Reichenbachiella agarivorans]|uniref:RDD family protein n=1 Tax=Reichenbachiella agarivorans TaxID=2979464 RepID=A0ABY6CKN0_9BACT|nr:RDD family protein [Reichenbachiella agarivorans]UXP31066.1 RDD family protein [Reichenbachiella agarivorans]